MGGGNSLGYMGKDIKFLLLSGGSNDAERSSLFPNRTIIIIFDRNIVTAAQVMLTG